MGFSLRNLIEQGVAQVNPFDGGKTGATVKAQQQKAAAATLPTSTATQNLHFSPQAKQAILRRDPVNGQKKIDGGVHVNSNPAVQPGDARFDTSVYGNYLDAAPKVGEGVGLGLLRSITGTAQGLSGLYDLATPGTGTNRASDWLDAQAKNMDDTAVNDGVNGVYKPFQTAGDALQFVVPGVGVAKAAEYLPKVSKAAVVFPKVATQAENIANVTKNMNGYDRLVTRGAEALADTNAAGRVAGAAMNGLKTEQLVNAAGGTAIDLGTQSGKGVDISPTTALVSAGTNLAGGVALNAAPQAAIEAVKAIVPTTKLVAQTTAKAAKGVAKERTAAVTRANQDTAVTKQLRQVNGQRAEIRKQMKAAQAAGIGTDHPTMKNYHKTLESLNAREYEIRGQSPTRTARQKVTDKLLTSQPGMSMKAVDAEGNTMPNYKAPKSGKNSKPDGTGAIDHQKAVDDYHGMYSDALRQMESGMSGGQSIPDGNGGYKRISEHSKFYRDYYAENGRAPSKAAWREEAKRQLESGKADSYAQNEYNQLKSPTPKSKPVDDTVPNDLEKIAIRHGSPRELAKSLYDSTQNFDKSVTKKLTKDQRDDLHQYVQFKMQDRTSKPPQWVKDIFDAAQDKNSRRIANQKNEPNIAKGTQDAQKVTETPQNNAQKTPKATKKPETTGSAQPLEARKVSYTVPAVDHKGIDGSVVATSKPSSGEGIVTGKRTDPKGREFVQVKHDNGNHSWIPAEHVKDPGKSSMESVGDVIAQKRTRAQKQADDKVIRDDRTAQAKAVYQKKWDEVGANEKQGSEASYAPAPANDIPDTPKPGKGEAVSKFPARVGQEERAQPIRPELDKLSTHKVKANDPVMAQAAKDVADNEDAALTRAKQGDSTEDNAVAMTLLNKYLENGEFEKANDLNAAIMPRFTRQGQETQILAAYSKLTPAGAVRYANKEVDREVAKSNKGKQLDGETKAVHEQLKQTGKEIADQIGTELDNGTIAPKTGKNGADNANPTKTGEKSPEQRLADRINATSSKTNEPDPVTDMVNTLKKVADEVLPAKGKTTPRDPMELIGQAIHDKENYAGVYDRAKKIVMDKYGDNPDALEELDKYFSNNPDRVYSKSQVEQGVRSGIKEADVNLSKLVKEHYTKVDATGTELKQKLIERAGLSESEAGDLAGDIQKRYDGLVQERKDSILKQMFGDKPTPEQVAASERILRLSNLGAMGRDELRPLVAKKLGLKSLTPEASQKITKFADDIQGMKEDSPERLRKTAEMMQYIEQQKPQSKIDNAVSVWKAGLLSGVKTQQGNAISNGMFALLKKISDIPAAMADQAFAGAGKLTGGRIKSLDGSRTKTAGMDGSLSGAAQGVKSGWKTLRTGLDERSFGDKYGQHAEIKFENKVIQKVLGKPANLVFRGMTAADQPWYFSALKNSLYDQAYAAGKSRKLSGKELKTYAENMVKNPSEQLVERATNDARRAVLGYDTFASRGIQWAHKGIDSMEVSETKKKAANAALNVLVPFVKVPAAFISRTVDFTPLGIPKEIFNQIADGKFDQRAASEAIGQAATGTAVMALGAMLSLHDRLSGSYPKNDPKEQQRWKAEGIQPNSVKIYNPAKNKDEWVSLNYFGPVGLLFNAAHNFAQAKGASASERSGKAIAGLGQGLLGQSFLQGFSGFSDAISDPEQSLTKYANSQAASLVPNIIGDAANVTDKFQRQADTAGEAIKNKIPVLRESNKKKQDVYGNELEQSAGKLNTLNGIKPSTSRTADNNVISEVSRLHTVDPDNSDLQVTPTAVGKTVKVNDQTVPLDNTQRYELQKKIGQTTQAKWSELMGTDEYKSLDDVGKAKALNNLRTDAKEIAEREYVTSNNLGTYDKEIGNRAYSLASGEPVASYATNAASGGSVSISSALDGDSKKVLAGYNSMNSTSRNKKLEAEPDYEYKVANAKFENDLKSGKLSKADEIRARSNVLKLQVGQKFQKSTRDLYGLNKQQLYALITTDPDGNHIATEVLAYGDALEKAGVSTNKFRTKSGAAAFNSEKAGGGSASSNKYSLFGSGGSGVQSLNTSLSSIVKKARLAKA